jgi:D-sedoheptulose 7-phosphate isomerase
MSVATPSNANEVAQQLALDYIRSTARESIAIKEAFLKSHLHEVVKACDLISQSIQSGGKLLICGNGGSAADAQHMAAEMIGRMLIERRPLPALALTTDSSNLTAIANDYSYDHIFEKQILGLGRKEDVLLAISTSGNSKNIIRACEAAKSIGMKVVSMTGGSGGSLKTLSDLNLNVEAGKNSSRIQETHIFIIHALVDVMDRFFLTKFLDKSE